MGLRVEDKLDGHSNYNVLKERMQSIFDEEKVWDIMVHTTENPVNEPIDVVQLAAVNKKNNKGKRLILDGIKDHCIPHVRGKRYAHEMWTALTNLYQRTNENRKMVLREKLEVIPPTELVRIAVNGLPSSWLNFADGVCARETLLSWERFWDDCIQTEIRKSQLGAAKPVEQEARKARERSKLP